MTLGHKVQLLTFTLASETYATHVESAREVLEFTQVTPLPKAPPWIRGVLNLRGSVIPVLDMKQKLGMGPTESTRDTCVLILEIAFEDEVTQVGMLADSVQEVIEIDTSELDPPPKFGSRVSTEYVRGVGRRNDRLFILLDIAKIFAEDEIETAQDLSSSTSEPGLLGAGADSTHEAPSAEHREVADSTLGT